MGDHKNRDEPHEITEADAIDVLKEIGKPKGIADLAKREKIVEINGGFLPDSSESYSIDDDPWIDIGGEG